MVTNYSVPRLTTRTPDSACTKLRTALKAVSGVEAVTLKPGTHEFEIRGSAKQEPISSDIVAASTNAGFKVETSATKNE